MPRPRIDSLARAVPLALGLLACGAATEATRPEPSHALGGALRLAANETREDLLVPQAHAGLGLDVVLRHAGAIEGGVLRADLAFGARYLMGPHDAYGTALSHGLRVRYAFELARGDWRFGLGPALGWEADIAVFESWDDAHAYWQSDAWLGVTASAATAVSECWRLEAEAELAVLGIQSRPRPHDFGVQDELDDFGFYLEAPQRFERFAWLADTQRLRLTLELWRSAFAPRVPAGWGFGLDARVVRTDWPRSAVILEAALRFTTMWGIE